MSTKVPRTGHQWLKPVYDWLDQRLGGGAAALEVKAATTGVLAGSPDYANGTAGVGATLTKHTAGAFPTQDGAAAAAAGDVYLVKDQADNTQNGLYQLTTVGGAAAWVLTRLPGYDTAAGLAQGLLVVVQTGTVNGGLLFEQKSAVVTMGTDAITFGEPTDLMTLSGAQTVVGAKDFAAGSMKIDNNSTTNAHTVSSAATQARTMAIPDVSLTVAQAGVASGGASASTFTGTPMLQAEQYSIVPPTAETTFGAATLVTDVAVSAVALTVAAQPAVPCKLNIIKTDADSSYAATVTIVGVGTGGEAIAGEVVALLAIDGSHTYVTANAYAKITSITVSALSGNTGADHIAVGQASALGFPVPSGAGSFVVYKEAVGATPASVPVNENVGTVDATARTVIPTTAANGVKCLSFWCSFTATPAGTLAGHTHLQT